ncbi:hypothetical protein RI119_18505 [Bacillus amyloliquefaciens]|uniref:hypothetical protein n=1 Tax=Bacillus amyloliquefaciens TaxID=1390 RepID=UPI003757D57E
MHLIFSGRLSCNQGNAAGSDNGQGVARRKVGRWQHQRQRTAAEGMLLGSGRTVRQGNASGERYAKVL